VFGASGAANFLSRATAILAVVFFTTSLGLTYFSARKTEHKGVMAAPAAPDNSLPAQIPGQGAPASAPEKSAPGGSSVPGGAPAGTKAPEVPK
jgi:preprotein translocase subunit SecG